MEEYKKSYKGFGIWLTSLVIVTFGLPFTPWENVKDFLLLMNNVINIWVLLLVFIIYKTEQIYWYSGLTFEKAKRAGSDARRRYAWEHVKRFGIWTLGYIIFSLVSGMLYLPWGIDFTIEVIGIMAVAISTIWIKLE